MIQVQTHSIKELSRFVQDQISSLAVSGQILLLNGEMGSGKTEFVKQLVQLLGGDIASSPSFAIQNTYLTPKIRIEHLDLYRLESEDELQSVGFWDLFENTESLIIIEWANKIDIKRLPLNWKKKNLSFKIVSENVRSLCLRGF